MLCNDASHDGSRVRLPRHEIIIDARSDNVARDLGRRGPRRFANDAIHARDVVMGIAEVEMEIFELQRDAIAKRVFVARTNRPPGTGRRCGARKRGVGWARERRCRYRRIHAAKRQSTRCIEKRAFPGIAKTGADCGEPVHARLSSASHADDVSHSHRRATFTPNAFKRRHEGRRDIRATKGDDYAIQFSLAAVGGRWLRHQKR